MAAVGTNPTEKKKKVLCAREKVAVCKEKDPEGTQERNKKMKDSSHGNSEPGN